MAFPWNSDISGMIAVPVMDALTPYVTLFSKKVVDLFRFCDIMFFVRMRESEFFHGKILPYTVVY